MTEISLSKFNFIYKLFRTKSVGNYDFGEFGDIYKWNVTSWNEEKSNLSFNTKDVSMRSICKNTWITILPKLSFRKISLKL